MYYTFRFKIKAWSDPIPKFVSNEQEEKQEPTELENLQRGGKVLVVLRQTCHMVPQTSSRQTGMSPKVSPAKSLAGKMANGWMIASTAAMTGKLSRKTLD
eukprot:1147543-Pelagomonas_calceolata.AAC.5